MEEIKTEKKVTRVGKNKEGYGYRYTDLAQINQYCEENNITYYQEIETCESNGNDYIYTIINEKNKEAKKVRGCKIVDAVLSGIKNPVQEYGSSLTYCRRYSLLMALGLATDDDDAQLLTLPSISSVEEAKAYKLTFGKYAGKKLGEVPENYLQWLFENGKDENIKTACDFIIKHTTKTDVNLTSKMQQLLIETDTDRDSFYKYFKVNNDTEMTKEQIEEAIVILEKKKEDK